MAKVKKHDKKQSTKAKTIRKWIIDIVVVIAASVIYSMGLHCFTTPNSIAPGGVSGIATVINAYTGINVGIIYGAINVPLIIIGFIFLGKKLMIKTIVSVATITLTTDYLLAGFPVYEGEHILAAIFGGLLLGAGLGLVYLRDGTSGGTDIVNKLINRKLPYFSLGRIMMATDAVIVLVSMLAFKSIESGLYSIIAIFVCSKVIDMILYGSFEAKMMLIFSDHYTEIADEIMLGINRGVTYLDGTGAYSGNEKHIICCAVRKNEYPKIKRAVKKIDPNAFIIITNAGEVMGEGFQPNN